MVPKARIVGGWGPGIGCFRRRTSGKAESWLERVTCYASLGQGLMGVICLSRCGHNVRLWRAACSR